MIIVRLMGGLGNQMFQFALGRRLAVLNDLPLMLDLSFFDAVGTHTPRQFELDVFNLEYGIATDQEIDQFTSPGFFAKILGASKEVITEKGHSYDPTIVRQRREAMFVGYWQSEKYFRDIRNLLLLDFKLKAPLSGLNKELAEKITNSEAISLHVRRGDYVTNAAAGSFHGLRDVGYYQKAVELISANGTQQELFIFSDDIQWCRANFSFDCPVTYIDHNHGRAACEDLRLMSMCRHNIVANSSFSWWGAWLNDHEDKVVVAPRQWFVDPSIDTKDVVPASWIRI